MCFYQHLSSYGYWGKCELKFIGDPINFFRIKLSSLFKINDLAQFYPSKMRISLRERDLNAGYGVFVIMLSAFPAAASSI